ncbi:MAG TPA: hypothetical protein VK821_19650 [Dehalococcoidia bacterium]|nr:hypothetical protein [Dehalococcoidia bacterium]
MAEDGGRMDLLDGAAAAHSQGRRRCAGVALYAWIAAAVHRQADAGAIVAKYEWSEDMAMAAEQHPINVSNYPALSDLVEEVARTRQPKRFRIDDSDTEAVLMPAKSRSRRARLTATKREQILWATFGAWKGLIDTEQLKRNLNELQWDESSPRGL